MGARAWAGRAASAGGSVREDAAMSGPARRDTPGNTACTLSRATAVHINASNTRGSSTPAARFLNKPVIGVYLNNLDEAVSMISYLQLLGLIKYTKSLNCLREQICSTKRRKHS